MNTRHWKGIARLGLSVGFALGLWGAIWLFLVGGQIALATAPIAGDPISTDGSVTILSSSQSVTAAVAADLNGDGRSDVAFADGAQLRIVANTSVTTTVSWPQSTTVVTLPETITDLTAVDLDRDGRVDLAVVTSDAAGFGEIQILRNPASPFTANWSQTQTVASGVQYSLATIVSGDLDGDGAPDLVTAGSDGTIRAWHNPMTSTREFTTGWGTASAIATGGGAISQIALADIDRDGFIDIAAVSGGSPRRVIVLQNPGNPFTAWSTINALGSLSSDGLSLVVADLDRDGAPDVAAGNAGGSIVAWRNPITGTQPFGTMWAATATVESAAGPVNTLLAADVDNDGYPELIRGNAGASPSLVAWHSYRLPFAGGWISHTVDATGQAYYSLAASDFNHDGDIDLVSGDATSLVYWPNSLIHRNAPWTDFASVGSSDRPIATAYGDLDNDGLPDLVTAGDTGGINLWRNNGTPFVSTWSNIGWTIPGTGIRSLVLVDLDRDGYLDFVTGQSTDHTVRAWQNDGTPFDNDWSNVGIGTFASYVMALASGDLDGSGVPEIVVGTGNSFQEGSNPPVTSTNFGLYVLRTSGDPFQGGIWTSSTISTTLDGVNTVALGDLDRDGLLDAVIGTNHAPAVGSEISPALSSLWIDSYQLRAFRNVTDTFGGNWPGYILGRDPGTYTIQCYDQSAGCPYHGYWGATINALALADLDNDGNLDIATADAWAADYQVKVWENDGTPFDGSHWSFSATGLGDWFPFPWPWLNFDAADGLSVVTADFNQDGFADVASGHTFGALIVWENGGLPFSAVPTDTTNWNRIDLGSIGGIVQGIAVADVDLDGDVDMAAGSRDTSVLGIWQNGGGSAAETVTSTASATILQGTTSDILSIGVTHNGIATDHDIELAMWRLKFEAAPGVPLTTTAANDLIGNLVIYRDTNGSAGWQASDIPVVTPSLSLDAGGVQTITFAHLDPRVWVTATQDADFFVVISATANAAQQTPNTVIVTFDTDADSVVRDRTTQSSASIQDTQPISTGLIAFVGSATHIRIDNSAELDAVEVVTATLATGNSLTVYANSHDAVGNFVANVPATWSLVNIAPNVAGTDLSAAGDNLSATFTARRIGAAQISATHASLGGDTTGFISVTLEITATPSPALSGDMGGAVVTATLVDQALSPVADGTLVTLTTDSPAGFGGQQLVTRTTAIGIVTATLTTPVAGTSVVSVTGNGNTGWLNVDFVNPLPTTSGLNPTSTLAGGTSFSLIVSGTHFIPSSDVYWNGSPLATTYVSAANLVATVPAANIATAGAATITVTNPAPGGGASNSQTFDIINPAPALTSLNPASANVGGPSLVVTATGTGFAGSSVVRWNGVNLATGFVSGTQLTATIPSSFLTSTGVFTVAVFNGSPGGGLSNDLPFTVTNPLPALTSISPVTTNVGGPQFTLNLTGTGFVNGSVVRWNGANLATGFVNSNRLIATVPAANLLSTGTFTVAVFNAEPGGGLSNNLVFTVTNPSPQITGLNPSAATVGGPAFTLVVSGTNFVSGAFVYWNGSARPTTFVSSTQLTATINVADISAVGSFPVTVVNPTPGGGTSNVVNFNVNHPAPVISLLSPNTTAAGGPGFTLTVSGTNFVDGASVYFNGVLRSTTFVNAQQLTASILTADIQVGGTYYVTVTNPVNVTSNPSPFTVTNALPTLTSMSPVTRTAGGLAFTLGVTGTGFANGAVVRWNGINLSTSFVNSTRLTATVLAANIASAGTYSVTVFNPAPGGGVSNALSFVVNNPLPSITSLNPATIKVNSPAFTLTVNGANFVSGATVYWNGAARPTTFVNNARLDAAIPASDITITGTRSITVTNPAPGGGTSNLATVNVTAHAIYLPLIARNP